jgi:Tol biopolymer transport system component
MCFLEVKMKICRAAWFAVSFPLCVLVCILLTACISIIDYGEAKDQFPSWSPDGHQVVFTSYYPPLWPKDFQDPYMGPYGGPEAFSWREICLMNADGTNRRRLTDNAVSDIDPDWSPDGSSIAFSSDGNICVVDIKSGEQINLSSHPARDERPHWSPDGRLIAFVSDRNGSDNGDVFTIKPDGSNVTRRTSVGWVSDLDWSPDAKRLVFYSRSDGDWEIYVLSLEDNSLIRLTDNEVEDMRPVWSPDGRSIAFASDREGSSQIYVMNLEAMSVKRISRDSEACGGVAWSPDGGFVSYVGGPIGHAQLHVWDFVENKLTVVAENLSVNGQTPRWSPDSQSLVYTRDEDANRDGFSEEKIWVVRRDGTGERRLSQDRNDK